MQETIRKGGRTDEYTALEELTLIVVAKFSREFEQ